MIISLLDERKLAIYLTVGRYEGGKLFIPKKESVSDMSRSNYKVLVISVTVTVSVTATVLWYE